MTVLNTSNQTKVGAYNIMSDNIKLIIKRITNLFTIKSIITLALIFVFCVLVLKQVNIPSELEDLIKIVIPFYFGTQTNKGE